MKRFLITLENVHHLIIGEFVIKDKDGTSAVIKALQENYISLLDGDKILVQEENEENADLFEGRE